MATYFHGNTELQSGGGDGLQTLILMNPSYIGFSDNGQQNNQQQNQSPNSNNNNNGGNNNNHLVYLPHAPPQQHFVGIPLSSSSAQDHHDAGFAQRVHYNLYNLPIDAAGAARVGQARAPQGLSLSLSSQQAYAMPPSRVVAGGSPPRGGGGDDLGSSISPSSGSGVSNNNGLAAQNQVLLGSKYLKAAQELLDEVVNVGKSVKGLDAPLASNKAKGNGVGETSAAAEATPGDGDGGGKRGAELSTVEKQEIQMKKAKLVNMLDEVEQRYRQYHHQMSIVIAWFEQAAGLGSAKTYTALALQTISKQFRCLKDAILAQIRSASKSLGEEDANEGKIEGSRLKYVDNQIRQQRALQQLGMIQHNAWRPQRGLPERAVSVLRAWLFEHFLHPYPKDSDKIMLAKQTGLTRSQVSNWFINARVRLWKPMVEEMYTEEMKDQDKNGSEEDNINNNNNKSEQNEDSSSKSTVPLAKSPGPDNKNPTFMNPNQENHISAMSNSSNSPNGMRNINPNCFNLIGPSDMETITQGSPKKLRSDLLQSPNGIASMKFDYERSQNRDGFTLLGAPANFIGGFGNYPMGELGRFGAEAFQAPNYSGGNGAVSLTLGLPHCENNLSIPAAAHQGFMAAANQGIRGVHEMNEGNDFGAMNAANASAHSSNVYETMNIQDRKRFVAQLLPDFVS